MRWHRLHLGEWAGSGWEWQRDSCLLLVSGASNEVCPEAKVMVAELRGTGMCLVQVCWVMGTMVGLTCTAKIRVMRDEKKHEASGRLSAAALQVQQLARFVSGSHPRRWMSEIGEWLYAAEMVDMTVCMVYQWIPCC